MLTKTLCSALIFGLLIEFTVCRNIYPEYSNYYDFNAYQNGLSPFNGGTLGSILAYSPEQYQPKANDQKRAYMRLGKRAMMRLGKRGSGDADPESGSENDQQQSMEKRARMRLGR